MTKPKTHEEGSHLYLLQGTLFSFEEWLKIESKDRLPLFFETLDLRPYVKEMKKSSPQGARGYSREAILRAFLAAPMEEISTLTRLHQRLQTDLGFRYQCGFRLDQGIPSISTLSRVFQQITARGLAEKLFADLVEECREEGILDGKHVAIDSTAVDAYEKKKPKSNLSKKNATWGSKFDSHGNKITWFGYKVHLAVDTKSELPIALEVTPAHVNDGDLGPALMEKAARSVPDTFRYVMMDGGYDQVKNYETAYDLGAQAIIPLNLRNEKEPPAGFSSDGTPRCSMGFEMVYWGRDQHRLKFRCPHAAGKVDCPHGTAWCSSSNYGMVQKVDIRDNLRRFSLPHRGSRNWKKLYDERTSVERCNGRLKENLTTNDLHVCGISKGTTHVYLNAIVLLATALAVKKTQASKEVA